MPIQYVNVGINPNDGTGDDLRSAFLKVNDNFQLLASIGGETNYGENVGGGSGQVYSTKLNEVLQFRTLAAGTGITINQSGNVITIGNSFTTPASFTKLTNINVNGNESSFTATGPGQEFKLRGTGAIQTTLTGNTVTIDGVFQLSDDLAPQLGGSLTLNGKNIIGVGNINITGSATVDSLTVGRSSGPSDWPGITILNGTLAVNSTTTLKATTITTLNATTSITSPSITATTNGFTGNLNGDTTGIHYGDVVIKGVGPIPDVTVINASSSPATINGNLFGVVSGDITGQIITPGLDLNQQTISGIGKINIDGTYFANSNPMTVNSYYYSAPIADYDIPTINYGGAVPIFTMRQQQFGLSETLKLRSVSTNSTQLYPVGSSIAFESVNVIDLEDTTYNNFNPIIVTSFESTTGSGPYFVAFNIPSQTTPPSQLTVWTVDGNSNDNFNGSFKAAGSTNTTITLIYDIDPGVYGLGTTTITPFAQDEYIHHGWIGINSYLERQNPENSNPDFSAFVARVRAKDTGVIRNGTNISNKFTDIIIARGDQRVSIAQVDIDQASIKPGKVSLLGTPTELVPEPHSYVPINYDLIIGNDATEKYINFYGTYDPELLTGEIPEGSAIGGYSFPKDIGSPGQVLTVPAPGSNLLEWATPSGGGGGGGGATYFNNLLDVPTTYLSTDAGKIVRVNATYSGLEFSDSISATVTGSLIGNASTATALQTTRTINGKNFNGTQNITLTTSDIAEGTNEYYTDTKVRNAVSVTSGKALTYTAGTGVFDLAEDTANTANTLVKRDSSGNTILGTLKVTTLQKNTADTFISVSSPMDFTAAITSNTSISTSGTVSAGFISLTGTGDQTLTSTAKIILNPSTSVDISGKKIVNLSTVAPTADGDAASKKYVDDQNTATYNASFQTLPVSGDSGGTLSLTRGSTLTVAGSTNITTSTTLTGVQVNLKSTISGVSVSGNLPVSGTMSATTAKGGNVSLSGNNVTQTSSGSDLNLIPGTGGEVVVSGGGFQITDSVFSITGYDLVEFAANTVEQTLTLTYNCTFIRTLNWVDESAGLAYAYLPPGTNGQIKMIVMSDRGTYGNALDTRPRYLVLRGNINGASRTINIATNDANGSSTFIFLNNYWWRIANVA
jgi:hypothetical protein